MTLTPNDTLWLTFASTVLACLLGAVLSAMQLSDILELSGSARTQCSTAST